MDPYKPNIFTNHNTTETSPALLLTATEAFSFAFVEAEL